MIPNMTYDKQKFAAITVRIGDPVSTVLLFTSGKMVLTGCKSYLQTIVSAYEVMRLLRVGFPLMNIYIDDVSVQNVVGNSDLQLGPDRYIDLDEMLAENRVYCTYLRTMFPGLIYRPQNSPVVLLLFQSGKVVITGGKSLDDVKGGWKRLWPEVSKYVKMK